MTTDDLGRRFALTRTGAAAWAIVDLAAKPSESRRVIAHIHDEDDSHVAVTWLGDIPLHDQYLTAEAALEDLIRWNERAQAWTRPVPIPHFSPATNA